MGYAETLTEYQLKKPQFLMFRTKCTRVATTLTPPATKT
jgi:uncharacterized protein with ATP-grasp and redox domains